MTDYGFKKLERPIKKDIQEKWIAALESGEYQQTKHRLHDEEGFCCLGVLCDLYIKEHTTAAWVEDPAGRRWVFADPETKTGDLLPASVVVWAGLNATNPDGLAYRNDNGVSFSEIATIIRKDFNPT